MTSATVERAYLVRGKTSRALVNYMDEFPFAGDSGPTAANIRPRFDMSVETRESGGICRPVDIDLSIRFTLTLPAAADERWMDRRTRALWKSFADYAKRHEMRHKEIYLSCARSFLAKAGKLSAAGCFALRRAIDELKKSEDERCRKRHEAFDRSELKRILRLPIYADSRKTK